MSVKGSVRQVSHIFFWLGGTEEGWVWVELSFGFEGHSVAPEGLGRVGLGQKQRGCIPVGGLAPA